MNAVYGAPDRMRTLAADLVAALGGPLARELRKFIGGPGKAMIVCATRDICARLYDEIIALRPEWHDDADDKGKIKVVYTGDPRDEPHIRQARAPARRRTRPIQQRIKDPDDELELVIVQSMLLTGFDAPAAAHPLPGQADAGRRADAGARPGQPHASAASRTACSSATPRSPRTCTTRWPSTPTPTSTGARSANRRRRAGRPATRPAPGDLRGDPASATTGGARWPPARPPPSGRRCYGTVNYLRDPALPANQVEDGDAAARTNGSGRPPPSSTGSSPPAPPAARSTHCATTSPSSRRYGSGWRSSTWRNDGPAGCRCRPRSRSTCKQLTASMIEAGGVTDIYAAAGIDQPDLSHLDEAYLEKLRASRTPNLAIEALRRAIEQQMRRVTRHNLVRQESFADRLVELMRRYTNQHLTSAEILAELVAFAREVSEESRRGRRFDPPLTEDELAFYDAVATNEAAVSRDGRGGARRHRSRSRPFGASIVDGRLGLPRGRTR